jgi:hypothetical protein
MSYENNMQMDSTGQLRIRNPGPHDVLCGRGGGINAHIGNVAFRELVKHDKERYNLEANKVKKAQISQDIVDRVKAEGGRFLRRDDDSSHYRHQSLWVEIDDLKALAKTSQALREGAPSIRATAKSTKVRPSSGKGKRTRRNRMKVTTVDSVNMDEDDNEWLPSKEKKVAKRREEVSHPLIRGYTDGHRGKQLISPVHKDSESNQLQETPNLLSPDNHQFDVSLPKFNTPNKAFSETTLPSSLLSPNHLISPLPQPIRMHSLYHSELNNDGFLGNESFINPFENDDKIDFEPPASIPHDSVGSNVSAINRMIHLKSSFSDHLNNNSSSSGHEQNENRKTYHSERSSSNNNLRSMRSFISQLSEIKNHENSDDEEVSFYDNLKSIRDASMPGLTSPRGGDTIPTPVIPFSDVKLSDLERFVIHGQG